MTTWVLTYLLHSTLLIGSTWLITRMLRRAAWRDILWKAALLLPLLTSLVQARAGAVAPEPLPAVVPEVVQSRAAGSSSATLLPDHAPHAQWFPVMEPPVTPPSWIVAGWFLGAVFFLSRLAWRLRRLQLLLRERTRIDNEEILAAIARMATSRGMRVPRITSSAALTTPIALLRWEIVIPTQTLGALTREQRESILAHELAHLARRDPEWLRLSELLKAVLFFQPLLTVAQRNMKDAAEELCDDASIGWTGARLPLAQSLTSLGASAVGHAALAASAMIENESSLVRRVSRVLQEGRPLERPMDPLQKAVAVVVVAGLMIGFSPGFARASSRQAAPGGNAIGDLVRDAVDVVEDNVISRVRAPIRRGSKTNRNENDVIDDGVVRTIGKAAYELRQGRRFVQIDARNVSIHMKPVAIEAIAPGGWLRVHAALGSSSHVLDITADDSGQIRRSYRVNGSAVAFETGGSAFLESVITTRPFQTRAATSLIDLLTSDGGSIDASLHHTTDDREITLRGTRFRVAPDGTVTLAAGGSFLLQETAGRRTRELTLRWRDGRQVRASRSSISGDDFDADDWARQIVLNHFPELVE